MKEQSIIEVGESRPAWEALEALGSPLGLSPQQCAAGVVDVIDSRMADLLRRVTIQRGQDLRSLVLWASGGASGAHAGLFGPGIGVAEVVFPLGNVASVWSAYGLTLLDHLRTFQVDATLSTPFDLRRLTADERARFDNSVRNGKNQMPPWKGVLTEEEIDQIWHYVRANAYQK